MFRTIRSKPWGLPRKLIMNKFFNKMGRSGLGYANKWAAASLLFGITGSSINLFFEEELQKLPNYQRNILYGGVTGCLYKSTLGGIPMGVGTIVGGLTIGGINFVTNKLSKANIIDYEMKF